MTRFWIRVNARLADDADVRAFAFILFPKAPAWLAVRTTCGLLVSLWGRVIDEQEDGNVSGRDDHALEEWAGWGGKRGLFAREFRARFTTDGQIQQWDEYQGTLITRRERDRDRKRTGKPKEVAPNSGGIPAEVRTHSSGNVNGNGQALVSAPYGAERQELTPDLALAPEGAAPAVAKDTDNHLTASAREALNRRGVRDEQIDAAPTGNLADHTAELAWRQTQYDAELDAHSARWMQEHPDETAEIGAIARVDLNLPTSKGSIGLTSLQMAALRGAVVEEIRKRNDWPTLDTWDGSEFKTAVSA